MSRLLDDLSPDFKPKAMELIARCSEISIPVMMIYTGRTFEEQAELYAQGRFKPGPIVTWTLESKHVMRPPSFKAEAIDLCPWEEFRLKGPDKLGWNAGDPVWHDIGEIGLRLGLKWGVVRNGIRIDLGHFQLD